MIGLIITSIIASLKDRLLVAANALEASLVALLAPFIPAATLSSIIHPIIERVVAMVTEVLEKIDLAEFEQEALGRMVELIKTGKSQASHDPGVDFGA
jgi:hypothetical protein